MGDDRLMDSLRDLLGSDEVLEDPYAQSVEEAATAEVALLLI